MTFIDLQMTVRPKPMTPLAPACNFLQKWFNSYSYITINKPKTHYSDCSSKVETCKYKGFLNALFCFFSTYNAYNAALTFPSPRKCFLTRQVAGFTGKNIFLGKEMWAKRTFPSPKKMSGGASYPSGRFRGKLVNFLVVFVVLINIFWFQHIFISFRRSTR